MDRKLHISKNHFHIRWADVAKLDWESFSTHQEADARAREFLRTGEKYTIEEFTESCERCRPKTATAS
jgi:hypothetical protein